MSTHAYSEDQLVEQARLGLFATYGWQALSVLEETFGFPSPPALLPEGEGFYTSDFMRQSQHFPGYTLRLTNP